MPSLSVSLWLCLLRLRASCLRSTSSPAVTNTAKGHTSFPVPHWYMFQFTDRRLHGPDRWRAWTGSGNAIAEEAFSSRIASMHSRPFLDLSPHATQTSDTPRPPLWIASPSTSGTTSSNTHAQMAATPEQLLHRLPSPFEQRPHHSAFIRLSSPVSPISGNYFFATNE